MENPEISATPRGETHHPNAAEGTTKTATGRPTSSPIAGQHGEQPASVKDEAQGALEKIGAEAKSLAADRKDAASDQLGSVAEAIEDVADSLEAKTSPIVAGYARDLAGGLKQASQTVKSRNVDEIVGMVQDFGRQQPLAFLGAAALAGFVASRFVLSSAERTRSSESGDPAAGSTQNPGFASGARDRGAL